MEQIQRQLATNWVARLIALSLFVVLVAIGIYVSTLQVCFKYIEGVYCYGPSTEIFWSTMSLKLVGSPFTWAVVLGAGVGLVTLNKRVWLGVTAAGCLLVALLQFIPR